MKEVVDTATTITQNTFKQLELQIKETDSMVSELRTLLERKDKQILAVRACWLWLWNRDCCRARACGWCTHSTMISHITATTVGVCVQMNAKMAMFEGQESLEAAAKSLALDLSRTKMELEYVATAVASDRVDLMQCHVCFGVGNP
jgi:hypothetical protein